MVKIVSSIASLIGETPIIKLNKVVPEGVADVTSSWSLSTRAEA